MTRTFTISDGTAAVDLDIPAVISETFSAGITKNGTGTLRFGGTNVYTGVTQLNGGKLLVDGSATAASSCWLGARSGALAR